MHQKVRVMLKTYLNQSDGLTVTCALVALKVYLLFINPIVYTFGNTQLLNTLQIST